MGSGQKNVHHPWPLALSTLSVRGRERVVGWWPKWRTPFLAPLVSQLLIGCSYFFTVFTTLCVQKAFSPRQKARAISSTAVLAAAALPLLAPPFCVRPALAVDVPTYSLQLVHVHATMLHNFHLGPTFQHWRMWSYINMAKPFVSHELRIAAVG